jgi:Putative Ig domain
MKFLCVALIVTGLWVAATSDAHAIYITSDPPTAARVGQPYTYPATSSPNGTWTLVSGPAGMTIGAATGVVDWTPTPDQFGVQHVTIRVTDAWGLTDTQDFNIQVSLGGGNCPPPIPPKKGP